MISKQWSVKSKTGINAPTRSGQAPTTETGGEEKERKDTILRLRSG